MALKNLLTVDDATVVVDSANIVSDGSNGLIIEVYGHVSKQDGSTLSLNARVPGSALTNAQRTAMTGFLTGALVTVLKNQNGI